MLSAGMLEANLRSAQTWKKTLTDYLVSKNTVNVTAAFTIYFHNNILGEEAITK